MKKTILIISAIALICITVYTVNIVTSSKVQKNNQVTSSENVKNTLKVKAPNIQLEDLFGVEVSLNDLKGKNVYINFWATWCGPCKGEMPDIEKLYQETKDTDLVILAVNLGEGKDTVKSFANSNKYNFKILLDTDEAAAALYNVSAVPSSFFIDKSGNIISKKIGVMSIEEMRSYISALVHP